MRKSRFSEGQIVGVLKEAESGVPVAELCRRLGVTDATFYHGKAKYGGLEVSEARRLRALEEENGRLKKIVGAVGVRHRCIEGGAVKFVVNSIGEWIAWGGGAWRCSAATVVGPQAK